MGNSHADNRMAIFADAFSPPLLASFSFAAHKRCRRLLPLHATRLRYGVIDIAPRVMLYARWRLPRVRRCDADALAICRADAAAVERQSAQRRAGDMLRRVRDMARAPRDIRAYDAA